MYLEHHLRRLRAPIRRLVPRRGALAYLAMMGPGFVTANAGNDAGGIATYAQAGAAYGYKLLWALLLVTVALIVVQEMRARMGAVTGKGLSDVLIMVLLFILRLVNNRRLMGRHVNGPIVNAIARSTA